MQPSIDQPQFLHGSPSSLGRALSWAGIWRRPSRPREAHWLSTRSASGTQTNSNASIIRHNESPAPVTHGTGPHSADETGRRSVHRQTRLPSVATAIWVGREADALGLSTGARARSLANRHTVKNREPGRATRSALSLRDSIRLLSRAAGLRSSAVPLRASHDAAAVFYSSQEGCRRFSYWQPTPIFDLNNLTHCRLPSVTSVARTSEDARKAFGNGPRKIWSSTSEHR